jgi:hypothetical protein
MPTRTVPQGFEEFHKRLVTSTTESEAAKKHRKSIEECLETNFGLLRFFRSGSFGNGTNIRNYSDVDYFASLPDASLKDDSGKTLSEVAAALRKSFSTTHGIRVDSPAVVVPFGNNASEAHEVIPADLVNSEGPFVYLIADGNGGWMRSSPQAQNDYVTSMNDKLKGKVKPLIRFLKAWKYFEDVPISSFYLELVTTKHAENADPIIYSWDVRDVLKKLWESKLVAVDDPAGKSGKVEACRTSLQKEDALEKVEDAWWRAKNARVCEEDGDVLGGFDWWDLVFDGNFPSYYY